MSFTRHHLLDDRNALLDANECLVLVVRFQFPTGAEAEVFKLRKATFPEFP